jgi:hypothetical protein
MNPSPSRGEGQGWGCSRRARRVWRGRRRLLRLSLEDDALTLTQPSPLEGEGS